MKNGVLIVVVVWRSCVRGEKEKEKEREQGRGLRVRVSESRGGITP